jgi:hypothetical protein
MSETESKAMKMEIKKENGRWLVNGKRWEDLVGEEREFFNEFIQSVRLT